MGGGTIENIKITAHDREEIVKGLSAQVVVDNDFVTMQELASILQTTAATVMRHVINKNYTIKRVTISGKWNNAISTADAKQFIKEKKAK
jgi:hypothetical protein